jgi:hypothetical protein
MKLEGGKIERGACSRQWFVRYVNEYGTPVKLGPFTSKAKAEIFLKDQIALYAAQ